MSDEPEIYDEWSRTNGLTQMPTPGLDDIDRDLLVREIRGAVWVAQQRVRAAHKAGHAETIKRARQALAYLYVRARAEKVKPYWKGVG